MPVLVDGTAGQVIIAPTEAEIEADAARLRRSCISAGACPIYANIGSAAEAGRALAGRRGGHRFVAHANFFSSDRERRPRVKKSRRRNMPPSCMPWMGGPVIIRTLDIGADKPAPFLPMPAEAESAARVARRASLPE